jgi:hypothetical protein
MLFWRNFFVFYLNVIWDFMFDTKFSPIHFKCQFSSHVPAITSSGLDHTAKVRTEVGSFALWLFLHFPFCFWYNFLPIDLSLFFFSPACWRSKGIWRKRPKIILCFYHLDKEPLVTPVGRYPHLSSFVGFFWGLHRKHSYHSTINAPSRELYLLYFVRFCAFAYCRGLHNKGLYLIYITFHLLMDRHYLLSQFVSSPYLGPAAAVTEETTG